ncbi:heterokaryon incompatibility protein-domain-containing protein [Apiospora sp. TS-2023a]
MRLIDVDKHELQSGFPDQALPDAKAQLWYSGSSAQARPPKYAILSHRWVGEEIDYDTFKKLPKAMLRAISAGKSIPKLSSSAAGTNPSLYKVAGACRQVRDMNEAGDEPMQYLWVDCVCINKYKGEGQEVTAAINAMFRWYQNSEVCLVYLFDVTWDETEKATSETQFIASQWFTRGWTLQERWSRVNRKTAAAADN